MHNLKYFSAIYLYISSENSLVLGLVLLFSNCQMSFLYLYAWIYSRQTFTFSLKSSHAVSYIRWHYQKQNFLNFILCSPTPALYAMIFVFCDISSLAYFHLLFHFVTSNLILWENESRILSKPCTVAFYLSQNKIRKK